MSDIKKHQDNPNIIKSGAGAIPENGEWQSDITSLCEGDSLFSSGCTESDARAWVKALKKYYTAEYLPAYELFKELLDEYELGEGNAKQRQVVKVAVRLMDKYHQKIKAIEDIKASGGWFFSDSNYYNDKVKDVVTLWDELAASYDAMMDHLPEKVDPEIIAGKSEEARERERREAQGGGVNWGTVAIVAGAAGLVFVGYKLWNE